MSVGIVMFAGVPVVVALASESAGAVPSQEPTNIGPKGGILISTGAAASGSTIGEVISSPKAPVGFFPKGLAALNASKAQDVGGGGLIAQTPKEWVSQTNPIDAALQKRLDDGQKALEDIWNAANCNTKKELVKKLNARAKDQGIEAPPFPTDTCSLDWHAIAAGTGAWAGQSIGQLYGGPLGALVGSIVGAWLGGKLEDLISSKDVRKWIKDRWEYIWGELKGFVVNVEDEIEGGVKHTIHYFESLF